MAIVISLDEARRRRSLARTAASRSAHPAGSALARVSALESIGAIRRGPCAEPSRQEIARLERAVHRLDGLARPDGGRDRLEADVERDLLTVVGELAMGWIDRAADRAEELCDRLAGDGR